VSSLARIKIPDHQGGICTPVAPVAVAMARSLQAAAGKDEIVGAVCWVAAKKKGKVSFQKPFPQYNQD
jgi:hypothetical protein